MGNSAHRISCCSGPCVLQIYWWTSCVAPGQRWNNFNLESASSPQESVSHMASDCLNWTALYGAPLCALCSVRYWPRSKIKVKTDLGQDSWALCVMAVCSLERNVKLLYMVTWRKRERELVGFSSRAPTSSLAARLISHRGVSSPLLRLLAKN